MKPSREMLEQQLERYREKLNCLNSYIQELNNMTVKHGTERENFEADLMEAECNVKYYQDEIARINQEIVKLPEAELGQTGADTILPHTAKQIIGSFIFSSISFGAGILLGSRLKSRRSGIDRVGEKQER